MSSRDDAVWKALADITRRTILDELRRAPRTTGDLCGLFEMTRFGVMKHLRALEEAGLVLVERRGRERWNHLNPTPIREIYRRWIRPFEEQDTDRLLRLKHVAEHKRRTKA
ncbi:MAG: ArsR/SmtB family transcription factor [Planctomycetota bacterium]|jgi:DNA-binding transcriptional ArsR family regulator